ncbi:phage tail assembly protein T [Cupriavidus basilensis]|uniref:phage tail assembly protein T n=1 Tax=Cupriavidus basilensis TaxID=68895 RepID=UPI003F52074A
MTSYEFAEYVALYELERRGGHYDDLRAGAIVSMIGNVHRDATKHPEPFGPLDFIPWNEHHGFAEPVFLENVEEQSALILRTMFPGMEETQ